jgi:hypothetical protein
MHEYFFGEEFPIENLQPVMKPFAYLMKQFISSNNISFGSETTLTAFAAVSFLNNLF